MSVGAFLAAHSAQLGVMALLLVASGFFSGTETALFNLTRGQLHRLRQSKGASHLAADLMTRPERTLHSLLLGNMIVNVAYSGISAVMVLDLPGLGLAPWLALLLSLLPLLVLILIGEVTPKMLAIALQERWAVPAAPLLAGLSRVFWPVLFVLDRTIVGPLTRMLAPQRESGADISNSELASVLNLSARRGIIGHDANALLQEIVELTDLRVRDIMVPRVDMVAYDVDEPAEGLLELFRRTGLRRIPVYEADPDHILGLVHAKRLLLQPEAKLRDLATPAVFAPEAGNLERLLLQFRVKRAQTAVVVDEYGGTAGLVTLQDVLEEIVGDIPELDESEQADAVREIAPDTYMLDANLAIHEWADAFKMDLASRRISTVGGFVTSQLGRIPRAGDTVDYRNLRFHVESMRGSRIGTLRLELLETLS
jgi:magnesium and cobalt exporter, CNNM family